jgi:hypothetical protein
MPAPFYNAIKGTTSGTPGSGAFTPNAAASGFRAWSTVPTGWIGLVRFEDGSAWELSFCYWNGTTLSRGTNQLFDSSTGSVLSLSSAAMAAQVNDASEVMSHLINASAPSAVGIAAPTATGTAAATTLATTNFLTEQPRTQSTSATTANAQAGFSSAQAMALVSTSAGHGGFEFVCRFGASGLPTGPRLFMGMTGTTFIANTGEPSALVANVAAFAKDSTDTNIQLLVNSNAGSGTKTDTGIALAANGWYEASIWAEPGSNKIYGLLVRLDTGAIWFGSTTTDVPANGALLFPQMIGGLSSTTGTAFVLQAGSMTLRTGS